LTFDMDINKKEKTLLSNRNPSNMQICSSGNILSKLKILLYIFVETMIHFFPGFFD